MGKTFYLKNPFARSNLRILDIIFEVKKPKQIYNAQRLNTAFKLQGDFVLKGVPPRSGLPYRK